MKKFGENMDRILKFFLLTILLLSVLSVTHLDAAGGAVTYTASNNLASAIPVPTLMATPQYCPNDTQDLVPRESTDQVQFSK